MTNSVNESDTVFSSKKSEIVFSKNEGCMITKWPAEHGQGLHPKSKFLVCPSGNSDFCPHWVSIVRKKSYTNLNLVVVSHWIILLGDLQLLFYSQYHLISSRHMTVHKTKFQPIAIRCHHTILWQKKQYI